MRWIVASLAIVAAAWLIGLGERGQEPEREEQTASSGRSRVPERRSKPDAERTIEDLKRYAANLSDEELWEEMESLSLQWLNNDSTNRRSRPPDLVVLLAREIGSRQGEDGLRALQKFLIGRIDDWRSCYPGKAQNKLPQLAMSLGFGAFDGWSFKNPAEAISRVLEPLDTDSADDRDHLPFPLIFSDDVSAGNRVLRSAFERLVTEDPGEAGRLLIEGTRQGMLDPNQIVEALLPALAPAQREELFDQLASSEGGHPFEMGLWREKVEISVADASRHEEGALYQILVRAKRHDVIEMISDQSTEMQLRRSLCVWLCLEDPSQLSLVERFPPDTQMDILSDVSADLSRWSFGPIDGKNQGMLADLEAHDQAVRRAIETSDLKPWQKADLLSGMQSEADGG